MVFDFFKGEFIDVISWLDETRDTMVWRFERRGQAIKYGAMLTVREGQTAVFVHEGQLADIFPPGLYQLETNNMPILTTLQHWDHGFQSPFKSEIYFISTVRFTDQKWGTRNPIMARDPEFGPVRLRAFGSYAMRVSDPGKFLKEIVGTDGEFTTDEVSNQIRNVIVQAASRVLAGSSIPVLDMASNTEQLGQIIARAIAPVVEAYGLEIPEFYVENISLPAEVEQALDKRTSMGLVGDLDKYMKFSAAEAMGTAESGAGSAIASGAGLAMGLGLAQSMGPWGAVPAQSAQPTNTPPPLPAEREWHLGKNGETKGPFTEAALKEMVVSGNLTRDTLVWASGMEGWMPAGESELASLFADMPPPLPPAP